MDFAQTNYLMHCRYLRALGVSFEHEGGLLQEELDSFGQECERIKQLSGGLL
jgi:hypothetical protein